MQIDQTNLDWLSFVYGKGFSCKSVIVANHLSLDIIVARHWDLPKKERNKNCDICNSYTGKNVKRKKNQNSLRKTIIVVGLSRWWNNTLFHILMRNMQHSFTINQPSTSNGKKIDRFTYERAVTMYIVLSCGSSN